MSDWSIVEWWCAVGGSYVAASCLYYMARSRYLAKLAEYSTACASAILNEAGCAVTIIRLSGSADDYTDDKLRRYHADLARLHSLMVTDPREQGIFMLRWHAIKLYAFYEELATRYDFDIDE